MDDIIEGSDPRYIYSASGGAGCHKIDVIDKNTPVIAATWKNSYNDEMSVENVHFNKNKDVMFAGVRFFGLAIINPENMEEINKL